ncbi:Predicted dienelactone hydrolase [Neorhodopirellula lusitana]|uniref:Predicted dienelactone hydrolase n=1 Tax=Neorhodopirellula lusitana TaxID=445327 RepID=A0ABY1QNJ7_9BACT|nr:acetylhydrolase [Neorhodopirellula lusitana]SMP76341.1 Predicted dienelactone hydrolase [Neorhodopirellula lusitana]
MKSKHILASILAIAVLATCLDSRPSVAASPDSPSVLDIEPNDSARDRVVPIRVYLAEGTQPQPVILVSHGLGGSRETKAYLGKHWSAAGFHCVFMQHAGSDRDLLRSLPFGKKLSGFKKAANLQNSMDRIGDVSFVLDQLEKWDQDKTHPLHHKFDFDHVGISGHSFGAATTLSVAGRMYPMRRSFAEPRIKAFLAMSPQPAQNISVENAFGSIDQPFLCMTGTKDSSPITPSVTPDSRQSVYRAMPTGDKFQLVLHDGTHSAFGDEGLRRTDTRNPNHHQAIKKISTEFWKAYLTDDANAKRWLQSNQPATDGTLEPKDTWESK